MKIRLDDIKCSIKFTEEEFYLAVKSAFIKTSENQKNSDVLISTINKDNVRILKKSIDARKKPLLFYVFSVLVFWDEPMDNNLPESLFRIKNEEQNREISNIDSHVKTEKQNHEISNTDSHSKAEKCDQNILQIMTIAKSEEKHRPVVVGSGPAGLFAALYKIHFNCLT